MSEEAGQSTIIVGTTRPVQYELKNSSDKLLQLKLFDTKLPKYRDRPLITTRFESAVNRITPVYNKSMPKTTLVAIELREAVNYDVEQKDDVLMIHFGPSSVAPIPLEQANLPDWKKILAQTEAGSPAIEHSNPGTRADRLPDSAVHRCTGRAATGSGAGDANGGGGVIQSTNRDHLWGAQSVYRRKNSP